MAFVYYELGLHLESGVLDKTILIAIEINYKNKIIKNLKFIFS